MGSGLRSPMLLRLVSDLASLPSSVKRKFRVPPDAPYEGGLRRELTQASHPATDLGLSPHTNHLDFNPILLAVDAPKRGKFAGPFRDAQSLGFGVLSASQHLGGEACRTVYKPPALTSCRLSISTNERFNNIPHLVD
jgi:hypothetical protein